MTEEAIQEAIRRLLPATNWIGSPRRLSGGLINEVWRVPASPEPLIVKYAPPYIATSPSIPLDPHRLVIESRCLALFGERGPLAAVATHTVRPPVPRAVDELAHILVMEDVGDAPHLGAWLETATDEAAGEVGAQLGVFIGRLHAASTGDFALSRAIDNRAIQETRLAVQYRAIGGLLAHLGVPDAAKLGREAEALGERLLRPGSCLIMGDLWPPSVLVTPAGLRVIDWEFAHYGNPAQDVGHLAAHLWMIGHRLEAPAAPAFWSAWLAAYAVAVRPAKTSLWDDQARRDAAVHAGCEILVRVAGAFRAGYLYDGHTADDAVVYDAVAHSVALLRGAPGGCIDHRL
ncbi:MAG: aminoglycoside phosphotransferase family protein [Rhodothermales bacterium]|nr:aminoglycoside phosphotransferase family protein [Rhodothermales bacterium]